MADTKSPVGFTAIVDDPGNGTQRDDVVNQCWFAKEALDGWQRRFGANDAALTLKALQERGFLATDISTSANKERYIEAFVQRAFALSDLEGFGKDTGSFRLF